MYELPRVSLSTVPRRAPALRLLVVERQPHATRRIEHALQAHAGTTVRVTAVARALDDIGPIVGLGMTDAVVIGDGFPIEAVMGWLTLHLRSTSAPVILLTSGDPAVEEHALAAGAADCLTAADGGARLGRAVRLAVARKRATAPVVTRDAALRQTLKLEAIGRLAGGVAHDFSNLLTIMMGATERMLDSLPAGTRSHDEADLIRVSCERGAGLTRQLLAFCRRQPSAPRAIDLRALMASAGRLLAPLIGEHIFLVIEAPADVWPVSADPLQFEQVVMNLVLNARDAMPSGGALTLRLRNACVDETPGASGHPAPGEYVLLEVIDSGVGMSGETMARAFEPFFSTKDEQHGTGLGLATVHDIVRELGGHVRIDSALGRGTTVGVYVPRCHQESAPVAPDRPESPLRGTETVLLTEDEAAIRDLVQTILERHGYTVIAAGGPADATALAESCLQPIDLLVTDIVMPGGTGPELADRLRERRPGLKVLYISGYPSREATPHGIQGPGTTFLPKPFTRHVLLRAVRDAIDNSGIADTPAPAQS
jgi:signal transduction histidine kinase/ActR/RegA family two-component response regulator